MPAAKGIEVPSRVALKAFSNFEAVEPGCYVSRYSTASHGYAQVGWHDDDGKRRGTTAHRAAWVHVNGQIPEGMTVDHKPTCDRRCVNVDHLRLLTNFENARRTHGRDWDVGTCINGHPNSELRTAPNGRTRCRLCKADYQRDYRKKKVA